MTILSTIHLMCNPGLMFSLRFKTLLLQFCNSVTLQRCVTTLSWSPFTWSSLQCQRKLINPGIDLVRPKKLNKKSLLLNSLFFTTFKTNCSIKTKKIGQEPWSSDYGRWIMFERWWVRIPSPYTAWTMHFSHWFVVKNCIVYLKRPKINKKMLGLSHFLKNNKKFLHNKINSVYWSYTINLLG